MEKAFLFNTGVPYWRNSYRDEYRKIVKGIIHIEFICEDVPKGAEFMYAQNNPESISLLNPKVIRREIKRGGLVSKYAFFRINDWLAQNT